MTGVAVGPDTITAGAVVLATGGFGNDPARLAAHYPSAAATGWTWYIGAPGSRGDALDLADQVGAQILGHDRGLRLLHANFAPIYEAYLPGWIVIVNREGRRFFDETAPYGITRRAAARPGRRRLRRLRLRRAAAATAAGVARYKQLVPGSTKKQSPHWNADVVEQMVADGKVHRADSVAALAAALGLPVERSRGHRGAAQRAASPPARTATTSRTRSSWNPIAVPPFYGAEIRPATVCFTACGPRIDRDAQVLAHDGAPVPGLFAAGECAGGVIGAAVRRQRQLLRQLRRLRPRRRLLRGARGREPRRQEERLVGERDRRADHRQGDAGVPHLRRRPPQPGASRSTSRCAASAGPTSPRSGPGTCTARRLRPRVGRHGRRPRAGGRRRSTRATGSSSPSRRRAVAARSARRAGRVLPHRLVRRPGPRPARPAARRLRPQHHRRGGAGSSRPTPA